MPTRYLPEKRLQRCYYCGFFTSHKAERPGLSKSTQKSYNYSTNLVYFTYERLLLFMKKNGKKKLLIIEDESSLSLILSDKFTREGFEVIEAKNGLEGLEKAKTTKPDLILLDIVMPTMDGITMIKHLREQDTDIPVLFLTNLSESERISEILGANQGIVGYLVKSHWQLDALVKKVRETLKIS